MEKNRVSRSLVTFLLIIVVAAVTFCLSIEQASAIIVIPPLDIEKSGPDFAYPSEAITYTIVVTNLADFDMFDVDLEDEMLGFSWLGDLSSGETHTFTLTYIVPDDAEGSLENLATVWVQINTTTIYAEASWTVEILPIAVPVDIKPGSWPNPLELQSKGVLPVAICGTEDFDVTTIDPETTRLTLDGVGVSPLRWSYEDAATPYTGEPCSGHNYTADGYLDLALKFKTQEVIQTLGLDAFSDGDVVILILTGNLKAEHGGALIQGQDCIVIQGK